ncbi:alpha/beta fold hydrolase [Xanthobacter sp. ZOL 2024]
MHPVALAAERLLAAIPTPRMVATPGGALACTVEGEGVPVLALHGIMGGLDQSWLLARALLPDWAGWRIISIARPGYPGSPLATGVTAEAQAHAYAALLDQMGLDRAFVAAFSGGGPSALAFARLYPARCRGLVLVSACTGRLVAPPASRVGLERSEMFSRLPGLNRVPAFVVRRWPHWAAQGFVPDGAERTRVLADPAAGPLLAALLLSSCLDMAVRMPGTLSDVAQFATLPASCADGVAAPLLALHGTRDGIVPFAHARAVTEAIAGARLVPLEGGTHMGVFTQLARVREAAAAFLKI